MATGQSIAAKVILATAVTGMAVVAVAMRSPPRGIHAPAPKPAAIVRSVRQPAPLTASRPTAVAAPVSVPAAPATSSPMVVRRVLDLGGPIAFGDYAWDEAGAPAGPIVITVDVAAQTLSVFRDGYEIGAAAILYGADEKPTPLGTFPITQKDAHHFSRTYDNAPMPYALRLTPDGVFIHGSKVEWGYATHGCIGVPVAFARKLFGVAGIGDKVIITRGKFLTTGQAITD